VEIVSGRNALWSSFVAEKDCLDGRRSVGRGAVSNRKRRRASSAHPRRATRSVEAVTTRVGKAQFLAGDDDQQLRMIEGNQAFRGKLGV
jgi:hypothetical protein